jgi:hypothetical protein
MAQKRIDLFGQLTGAGVDNTAGAGLRALAGLASTVGGIAGNFANKEVAKQGRQQGLESVERDEVGEVIAPEEKGDFTAFDRAYNEGALLSYRAEVGRDTRDTIQRLKNEHQADPELFESAANKYLEGVMKDMPSGMAPIISNDIKEEISSGTRVVRDKFYQTQKKANIASIAASAEDLNDDILNAAREGDQESVDRYQSKLSAIMSKGVEAGLVDPVKLEQQAESLREQIITNKAMGEVTRIFEGEGAIDDKIASTQDIVSGLVGKHDLSPMQRDYIVSALQATANEQVKLSTQKTAAEEKAISFKTVELQLDAQFGRKKPAEIQGEAFKMFSAGELSEKEYKGVMTKVITNQDKAIKENAIDIKVSKRVAGDSSVEVNQKEVDAYYKKNVEPMLEDLSSIQRSTLIANTAIATGIVPSQVTRKVKNSLRSGNTELIAEATDIINRLDTVRGVDSGVDATDRAFASIVNDMTGIMEPQEAIKYANELTDPRNTNRVELREAEIKDMDNDYPSLVESEFDSIWSSSENVDQTSLGNMAKEYKDIFETHFKAGMDESEAHSTAEKLLNKNWSYSESSKRTMKYAPETYYQVQGDSSYITKQLNSYVNSNFVGIGKINKTMLISDQETGRMASTGNPDYLIVIEKEDGLLDTLMAVDPKDGKTKRIRWSPDKDKEEARQIKENEKAMVKARSAKPQAEIVQDALEGFQ